MYLRVRIPSITASVLVLREPATTTTNTYLLLLDPLFICVTRELGSASCVSSGCLAANCLPRRLSIAASFEAL